MAACIGQAAGNSGKMKFKCIFALAFALIMISHIVFADGQLMKIKHTGKKSYFEISAEPGTCGEIDFDIYNDSGSKLKNYVLLYDSITAVNGGNEIMSPEDFSRRETAGWFRDNLFEITLSDGSSEHIKLNFEVPEDTVPGIYTAILGIYSAVDAIEAESGKDDGISLNINNYYTSTLAIVINVGIAPKGVVLLGDMAEIKIDAKKGISYLYIPVKNAGQTYEFPILSINLSDKKGKLLFEGRTDMGIVYRNTDTFACFCLGGSVSADGEYRIECIMRPNEAGRFDEQAKVFLINLEKEKAREALVNQIKAENGYDPDWSGGYFILGKKQLLLGLSAAVILILTICSLVLFYKKKRINSARS